MNSQPNDVITMNAGIIQIKTYKNQKIILAIVKTNKNVGGRTNYTDS